MTPPTWPYRVGDPATERVRSATGLLRDFNEAGVLDLADVHVAQRLGRLGEEPDEQVLLAAALAVRAVRLGSVCLDLASAAGSVLAQPDQVGHLVEGQATLPLAWPPPDEWLAVVAASRLVAAGSGADAERPLRLVDGLLYLDRYWCQERVIADGIDERMRRPRPRVDEGALTRDVTRLFGAGPADRQRLAATVAAYSWVTVLAGGPGTGKTTTVAKLVALLQGQPGAPLRVALAAPTGKAAARLAEAVREAAAGLAEEDRRRIGDIEAMTLHRLLGWKPGARTRFRHDRDNRLPHDLVVVDEASMVALTLMSRLVEALREETRLVLVGDPDQLASVEAGAVLGDLVRRPPPPDATDAIASLGGRASGSDADTLVRDLADLDEDERERAVTSGVVRLGHVYRFGGAVKDLAEAVRSGEAARVHAVLEAGGAGSAVELGEADVFSGAGLDEVREEIVAAGVATYAAAAEGRGAEALELLARHRLLCAHRAGAFGVSVWGRLVEEWLTAAIPGYGVGGPWYVGRPLLVTANDHDLGLYNGDTGVVVAHDGQRRAAFRRGGSVNLLATHRLGEVQSVYAMTVHRSQGSQFDAVTLVLPPADSPLLTRELLYTAVTRARSQVRLLGGRDAVSVAVGRPILRASGLHRRPSADPA